MPALLFTGAASGIGRELTQRAIARGDRVIAADRSQAGLDALGGHANLLTLNMDVGSTESVAAGFGEADRWLAGTPLYGVVNCAAICPLSAFEAQPIEVLQNTLNVNTVGSARLLREAMPRLRGNGGRIVLISSLWGKVSGPMISAYCASKHAIEAIADSARRETHGQDIHIIVVEPGVVRTHMVSQQVADAKAAADNVPTGYAPIYGELYRKYFGLLERTKDGGVTPTECAAQIEKALFARKPNTRYRIGKDSVAVTTLARVLSDRALDGVFRSMMK